MPPRCPLAVLELAAVAVVALGRPPAAPVPAPTTFSSLTLVGERWNNGQWAKLDKNGRIVGATTLKRGDSGAELISSPRQSPVLMPLSAGTVLCGANDTTFISSDGGRSWARHLGHDVGLPPSVPAPKWMKREHPGAVFMDVQPIDAYLPGCYKHPQSDCKMASSVTAAADWPYTDWDLENNHSKPQPRVSVGRQKPNTWSGLPVAVLEMCTECGGGAILPDGSYVFLAVVQWGHGRHGNYTCPYTDCCNSVVSFTSKDGLAWTYTATVGAYDESRIYQEGPNECAIVLLKDQKTLVRATQLLSETEIAINRCMY